MNYLKVIGIGTLCHDPELRYTPKGTAVCEVRLAFNRVWYDSQNNKKEDAVFMNCSVWSKTAELVSKSVRKGESLFIDGYLQQNTVEKDGRKTTYTNLVAERVILVGCRKDKEDPRRQEEPPSGSRSSDDEPPF